MESDFDYSFGFYYVLVFYCNAITSNNDPTQNTRYGCTFKIHFLSHIYFSYVVLFYFIYLLLLLLNGNKWEYPLQEIICSFQPHILATKCLASNCHNFRLDSWHILSSNFHLTFKTQIAWTSIYSNDSLGLLLQNMNNKTSSRNLTYFLHFEIWALYN